MFWDASSRRVCGHLLHYQCAQELPSKSFPSCRPRSPLTPPHLSPGASVEELPALPLRLRQGGRAAVARASARGVLPHRDKARTCFLLLSVGVSPGLVPHLRRQGGRVPLEAGGDQRAALAVPSRRRPLRGPDGGRVATGGPERRRVLSRRTSSLSFFFTRTPCLF